MVVLGQPWDCLKGSDALLRSTKVEGFVMHHPKGPLQIVVCSCCFGDVYILVGGHFAQVLGNSEDWRRIWGEACV